MAGLKGEGVGQEMATVDDVNALLGVLERGTIHNKYVASGEPIPVHDNDSVYIVWAYPHSDTWQTHDYFGIQIRKWKVEPGNVRGGLSEEFCVDIGLTSTSNHAGLLNRDGRVASGPGDVTIPKPIMDEVLGVFKRAVSQHHSQLGTFVPMHPGRGNN